MSGSSGGDCWLPAEIEHQIVSPVRSRIFLTAGPSTSIRGFLWPSVCEIWPAVREDSQLPSRWLFGCQSRRLAGRQSREFYLAVSRGNFIWPSVEGIFSDRQSRGLSGCQSGRLSGHQWRGLSARQCRGLSGRQCRGLSGRQYRGLSGRQCRGLSGRQSRELSGRQCRGLSGRQSRGLSGRQSRGLSGRQSRGLLAVSIILSGRRWGLFEQ